MLLIAGLGNPGTQYERTRHNAGFMLVDRLSAAYRIGLKKAGRAVWGRGFIAGEEVVLLKPQTFMNLSGEAVAEFRDAFSLPLESIVAAHDDCDLPLGRLRLRKDGGSGGHRGVASIIERLGGIGFGRIRIGVGRPPCGSIVDYVLSPFTPDEQGPLEQMLERGVLSVEALVKDGVDHAMNRFNTQA